MLPDDPAFFPELALPDFDLSLLLSDVQSGLAARSTVPRGLATARTAPSEQYAPQLIIPTSEGDGRRMLPFGGAETSSSDLVNPETFYRGPAQDDDEGLLADVDFEFDAEGNLRTVGRSVFAAPAATEPRARMEPDSAASARVRREHEDGLKARQVSVYRPDECPDLLLTSFQLGEPVNNEEGTEMDVEYDLPEGLPFSPRLQAAEVEGAPSISRSQQPEEPQALPSPAESAPLPRRRQPRAIGLDEATELRRNEITAWNNYYANNMAIASKAKHMNKLPSMAKHNAALWVFGAGVGNIGFGVGQGHLAGELHVFSGERLMQLVRPVEPPETPRKRKTPSDDEPTPDSEERRVRARQGAEDEVGRGGDPMDVDDSSGSRGFDDVSVCACYPSSCADQHLGRRDRQRGCGGASRPVVGHAVEHQRFNTWIATSIRTPSWARHPVVRCADQHGKTQFPRRSNSGHPFSARQPHHELESARRARPAKRDWGYRQLAPWGHRGRRSVAGGARARRRWGDGGIRATGASAAHSRSTSSDDPTPSA